MKQIDTLNKCEALAIKHCPTRDMCPIGSLCGTVRKEGHAPLFPTIIDVKPGDMVWADLRFEQKGFFFKSGVYACVVADEQEQEMPFGLFGCGIGFGIAELYTPREASSSYYLRALTSGSICSIPIKTLRYHLENIPQKLSHQILSSSYLNLISSSHTQQKILSKKLLTDRVTMLLIYLRYLAARENRDLSTISLTHSDIAFLVMSDRVSVTRTLHALEQKGLVSLGYKSLMIHDDIERDEPLSDDARSVFWPLNQPQP